MLLRHVLGMDRAEFFASLERPLSSAQADSLSALVDRRLSGEPLAYITGHREFYSLDFRVNPSVLIPRQETELVVDVVLSLAAERRGQRLDVADVGTGSGAIAVTIACHLPNATIHATDTSTDALSVAEANARRHGVLERVRLYRGDLLSPLVSPVDIIASNPPYIRTSDLPGLAPEVRWEPIHALDGGPDGLDTIRRLVRQVSAYLRPSGSLVLEISPEQVEGVSSLVRQAMPDADVSFERDLLGHPRVVRATTGHRQT